MLHPLRLRLHVLGALVLSSLFVVVAGCSRTGQVSGKVYYQNKPLPGGTVQFFPEGKGGDFSSPIKEDGSYSVSKLPPGPAKISVFSTSSNPMAMVGGRGPAAQGMKQAEEMRKKARGDAGSNPAPSNQGVAVPPKYSDPEKSNLKLDVTGGSQSFDIKLD
jgi:hypothetical protein